jgi:AICAR transformylase/IMP cyclohydrolase PurH
MTRAAEAADQHRTAARGRCVTARTRIRRLVDSVSTGVGRRWQVHQGKELSYTNLLDLDAALRIALEFTEPARRVIKHTNPCGVATGATIDAATCARARPMRCRPSAASSG